MADDATLAHSQALHDFDVLALELEKLGGHFCDRLPRFANSGAAADWHLNLPGREITFQQWPQKREGVGGWVVQLVATYLWR